VIREYRTYGPLEQQRTQATLYHEDLARTRDTQAEGMIPRSSESWGAEQTRLGSWRSGVGSFRPSGIGSMYQVGQGRFQPVGKVYFTQIGRAEDTVERLRDIHTASVADSQRTKWRQDDLEA